MRRLIQAVLALTLLLPLAVAAQNPGQISMKTPGLEVRFDPPPWSVVRTIQETSELYSNEGKGPNGTIFQILQFVPKGESFEQWNQLYAATVERPLDEPLEGYVNGQLAVFTQACDKAGVFHQQDLSETARVLIIFCSAYKDNADRGEVAFFRMEKLGQTLVKVYHHIRVPAFDITTSGENPPLDVEKMRADLTRVGRAQLVPTANN